jgi:hypothetical protein
LIIGSGVRRNLERAAPPKPPSILLPLLQYKPVDSAKTIHVKNVDGFPFRDAIDGYQPPLAQSFVFGGDIVAKLDVEGVALVAFHGGN